MQFTSVRETTYEPEARMIQGLLEANGFHVKLMGAYEAHYPPTYPIEIQVPEGEAVDARQLLDAHEQEPDAEDEDDDAADGDPGY